MPTGTHKRVELPVDGELIVGQELSATMDAIWRSSSGGNYKRKRIDAPSNSLRGWVLRSAAPAHVVA